MDKLFSFFPKKYRINNKSFSFLAMYLYKVWTEDDHQAIVFMSCDGEESQIRVLLEETIATRFSDLRIVVAKTPRSCSGIYVRRRINPRDSRRKKGL